MDFMNKLRLVAALDLISFDEMRVIKHRLINLRNNYAHSLDFIIVF